MNERRIRVWDVPTRIFHWLSGLHRRNMWLIVALVGLHLLAVLYPRGCAAKTW